MTSHRGDAVSSPAHPLLRPPATAAIRTSGRGTAAADPRRPVPETARHASASVTLRLARGREALARARSFTRDTLRDWSLGHHCDDATLVITELTANAVTHAAPRCAGAPDIRLGFRLEPAHLLLTVSDPDDHPPVRTPGAGSGLEEDGRGLRIVAALSEGWGWTPTPPAGKTVWARLSTRPPI
ncbi:ATP-binding protein [Streptomyces sp. NPDC018972]|uniref:ATP-binding protein n=1 Tax=Streptomyces sp. NPDC018972 TaxID=3365060 RepID=UPI0037B0C8BE